MISNVITVTIKVAAGVKTVTFNGAELKQLLPSCDLGDVVPVETILTVRPLGEPAWLYTWLMCVIDTIDKTSDYKGGVHDPAKVVIVRIDEPKAPRAFKMSRDAPTRCIDTPNGLFMFKTDDGHLTFTNDIHRKVCNMPTTFVDGWVVPKHLQVPFVDYALAVLAEVLHAKPAEINMFVAGFATDELLEVIDRYYDEFNTWSNDPMTVAAYERCAPLIRTYNEVRKASRCGAEKLSTTDYSSAMRYIEEGSDRLYQASGYVEEFLNPIDDEVEPAKRALAAAYNKLDNILTLFIRSP